MSGWGKNNPDQGSKKSWSYEEAKEKIGAYCAYQERCVWEVRRKMNEKGINASDAEKLVMYMISEGFLEEERYVRAFARGKFRLKKWGRSRISRELKMKQIPEQLIRIGISEIDQTEYYETLRAEVEKKWEKTHEKDPYKKRFKVIGYLMNKGFEQELIQEIVDSLQ